MKLLCDRVFACDSQVLAELRALLRQVCQQAGCNDQTIEQIVLAVNEACMNILVHGYDYRQSHVAGQTLRLLLLTDDGELLVRVLDHARPVSEADWQPRALDDLRPGGLGVHFMREVMDTVGYLQPPDGYSNLLQMTKRIAPATGYPVLNQAP